MNAIIYLLPIAIIVLIIIYGLIYKGRDFKITFDLPKGNDQKSIVTRNLWGLAGLILIVGAVLLIPLANGKSYNRSDLLSSLIIVLALFVLLWAFRKYRK